MCRAERISKALRAHDDKLFCRRSPDGILSVYRKGERVEWFVTEDGSRLGFLRPDHHMIFCLTDTWGMKGQPKDWGIEPILHKIRASDLWHRDIAAELEEQDEKATKSAERTLRNNNEAFLSDQRGAFKKAFADINTASMDKTENKRRLRDYKCQL
jgi:hypothetical protein